MKFQVRNSVLDKKIYETDCIQGAIKFAENEFENKIIEKRKHICITVSHNCKEARLKRILVKEYAKNYYGIDIEINSNYIHHQTHRLTDYSLSL